MPDVGDENTDEAAVVGPQEDGDYIMSKLVNPVLFTRGVPTSDFYLILSGKVMVCSGNEGFMIE